MAPYRSDLRDAQAAGTRERILRALGEELAGEGVADLSIARVATRAGVAERTVYRHFESREALAAGLADWVNERLGDLPDDLDASDLGPGMARMFAAFDDHEAMVRGTLASPGGREARAHARAHRVRRIDAALEPALRGADPERAAAVRALILLLCSAPAWQLMRDDGGLDGEQAGRAVQWAIESLLDTLDKE